MHEVEVEHREQGLEEKRKKEEAEAETKRKHEEWLR